MAHCDLVFRLFGCVFVTQLLLKDPLQLSSHCWLLFKADVFFLYFCRYLLSDLCHKIGATMIQRDSRRHGTQINMFFFLTPITWPEALPSAKNICQKKFSLLLGH